MLSPHEREFALTELTLSLLDANAARAIVDSMTLPQERVVRNMIAERDAEKKELMK
jgi:hypothetical protein